MANTRKGATYWAHLAGMVDGDGCITITCSKKPSRLLQKCSPMYFITLAVGNTYLPYVRKLRSELGGYLHETPQQKSNHKPLLSWTVSSRKAVGIIQKIAPYLKIKHRQAALALLFASRVAIRKPPKKLTKAELNFREACKRRMKKLNQRGLQT